MLTETKVLKQVTFLPQANAIQVQWGLQVKKDDAVISETFERKAYSADQLPAFSTEVGAFDVNAFAAAFNVEALDAKVVAHADKVVAEAAKNTAETILATEMKNHVATQTALATSQEELVAAQNYSKLLNDALTQQATLLIVKDAEIAALKTQIGVYETQQSF